MISLLRGTKFNYKVAQSWVIKNIQLDSYGIPNRTFHLLIHIGILPKNVSDSDVTGWNSQMAGQSDKNDAAREEFILEPLPASFSSKSHWKMGAVFAL